MASQHINISTGNSRLGDQLRALIDSARNLQNNTTTVKDIAEQVASGGDWVALGAQLGVSAADAETAYNLLVGFSGAVSDAMSEYQQFIDKLG